MAIHDFDMARYLLGEDVVEVNVTATSLVIPEAAELGDVDLASSPCAMAAASWA